MSSLLVRSHPVPEGAAMFAFPRAGEKALCRLLSSGANSKGRAKQRKLDSRSHLLLLLRALYSDGLERLSMLSQVGDDRTRCVGRYLLDHPSNTGTTPLAIKLQEGEDGTSRPG